MHHSICTGQSSLNTSRRPFIFPTLNGQRPFPIIRTVQHRRNHHMKLIAFQFISQPFGSRLNTIFAPGMQSENSFTPLHKKILCTFYITNKSIAQLGHGNLQYIFPGLYDHHCGTTGYRKISLNNQTDFLIGHTGYLTPSDIRGGTYLFTA